MQRVRVIDSHTEGEPTRVVVEGVPDLGGGSVASQAAVFAAHFDWFRSAVVNEPRGNDFLVGALIVPAADARAVCGVIFFNNVGLLNACGHGTLGLAATLVHMGRIGVGSHIVETPVGVVTMHVRADGTASIENVPSYRFRSHVPVEFAWNEARYKVYGDIAWGGNWFYLISDHGRELALSRVEELTSYAWAVRAGLEAARITGDHGGVIDHIELFGPPVRADCDSRNFVLCPGKAYDRSPCGTGTSAKMACLFADGKLKAGEPWRQESIIGSRFVGSVRPDGHRVLPTIAGGAFITAESTLVLDPRDPFRHGIRA